MDARFMQMHNFVLTREIIINSIFPVDRMRELNFHRETAGRVCLCCLLKVSTNFIMFLLDNVHGVIQFLNRSPHRGIMMPSFRTFGEIKELIFV